MSEYRHYERLDAFGNVVLAFSSAFPEIAIPMETDICVNEDGERHYNPALKNKDGQYLYHYVNGIRLAKSEEDMFDLEVHRIERIDELSAICQSEILSDFTSNALGQTNSYGFDTIDQENIKGIALNLLIEPELGSVAWKTRESIVLVPHSREQFFQVVKDSATHQKTIQYKYLNLKYAILQATDKDSVDAIVW